MKSVPVTTNNHCKHEVGTSDNQQLRDKRQQRNETNVHFTTAALYVSTGSKFLIKVGLQSCIIMDFYLILC